MIECLYTCMVFLFLYFILWWGIPLFCTTAKSASFLIVPPRLMKVSTVVPAEMPPTPKITKTVARPGVSHMAFRWVFVSSKICGLFWFVVRFMVLNLLISIDFQWKDPPKAATRFCNMILYSLAVDPTESDDWMHLEIETLELCADLHQNLGSSILNQSKDGSQCLYSRIGRNREVGRMSLLAAGGWMLQSQFWDISSWDPGKQRDSFRMGGKSCTSMKRSFVIPYLDITI